MQILDETKKSTQGKQAPPQAEFLPKRMPSTLASQPGLGTTSSSMSTLSPKRIVNLAQHEYNLPLQRRPQDDERAKQDTQQSHGQMRPGTGGQTNLTTFGGDQCQFSNSQIFQRSGQTQGRRETSGSLEPGQPSGTQARPAPFPNPQRSNPTGN